MNRKPLLVCAFLLWAALFCQTAGYAQSNTDVFLVNLTYENEKISLGAAPTVLL